MSPQTIFNFVYIVFGITIPCIISLYSLYCHYLGFDLKHTICHDWIDDITMSTKSTVNCYLPLIMAIIFLFLYNADGFVVNIAAFLSTCYVFYLFYYWYIIIFDNVLNININISYSLRMYFRNKRRIK